MKNAPQLINLSFVETIINNFNGSAHLKDLSTGEYVFSNQTNAINLGLLKVNDLLGLTVWDINHHMKDNWGDLAGKIQQFDQNILKESVDVVNDNQISLLPNGFVAVHNMKKFPVPNHCNKVKWVLTLSEQITQNVELIKLYALYIKLYNNNKRLATSNFITFLNANHLFHELPTEAEMKVLLLRQRYHSTKEIAQQMSVAPKTISSHIANLRSKLTCNLLDCHLKL